MVFAITPKDIFHVFHNHEHEIEHVDLDCHNQHFETKHTHCPILNQVAPIFYVSAEITFSQHVKVLADFKTKSKLFQKTPIQYMFGLKAPPAATFQTV